MSAQFPVDQLALRRYIEQFPPRTRGNANAYRSILGQFVRFAARNHQNDGVSQEVLQSWFRCRAERFPEHRVPERTWLLDTFLDWLVTEKVIASNPFAKLRETCGERKRLGIVRALLRAEVETALAALRPVPRFASHLGAVMREHVDLMHAIGLRYQTHERRLLRFDRFVQRRVDLASAPLPVLIEEGTKEGKTPQHVCSCVATGRIVAKAMARIDPTVEVPHFDSRLEQQARNAQRRPRILTEEEVARLLAKAKSFRSPNVPLRPMSLYTMLVLAYCAGLRSGEIVRLKIGDIDPDNQTVEVRETKFYKSRRLPVIPTVMAVLCDYLAARCRSGASTEGSAPLFWAEKARCGYDDQTAKDLLTEVFRLAGLKPTSGRTGPRLHDLRNTFAVHRLTAVTSAEVLGFLLHCEQERGVSLETRNCRLAALRSFFSFVAGREPQLMAQCAEVLRIPTKRMPQRAICYLEPTELEAILAQSDRKTLEGQRDHALLAFLYNTGARIQEALDVSPDAIRFEAPAHVRLLGKGRKERLCPLWPETVQLLKGLLKRQPRTGTEPVFTNKYGRPIGASGVRFKLRQ